MRTPLLLPHTHAAPTPPLPPSPDGMVVCHLPYGPTAYFGVFNAVLRHDIGQKKEVGTIRCVCVWGGAGGGAGRGRSLNPCRLGARGRAK